MDDARFKNKFRISTTRKPNWDYGSHGLYYVTICTKDRLHYFGEVVGDIDAQIETQSIASLLMTDIGEIAYNN